MLSQNDLMEIQRKMREAEADTTPFTVIDGDGNMSVVGDANKTEPKTYDYVVRFRIPAQYKYLVSGGEETLQEIVGGKYIVTEVAYPNVCITPRMDIKIVNCLNDLKPFLVEILEDGESKDRDKEELGKFVVSTLTNDAIMDAMYNLVKTVVGVDDALVPMMMYDSVFENVLNIIRDFPEVINEEDFFTGKRSLTKEKQENQ